jgi:predicted nucleotidyltransferase
MRQPTRRPESADRWRSTRPAFGLIAGYSCAHMVDDAVIQEAGRRLSEAAPNARIILFGSHARGEAGKHSDLDLLVIEPKVGNPARESVRLRRALGDLVLAADVIVASEDRVREWRDVRGSLIHAALSEGRELAA